MTKQNKSSANADSPINKSDLEEFLKTTPDFVFELRCLELLNDLGLKTDHGSSYVDPITSKFRQYDIRTHTVRDGRLFEIRLAIECKNLRPECPLLVYCVPRTFDEGFHELIVSLRSRILRQVGNLIYNIGSKMLSIPEAHGPYPKNQPVGKCLVQVRRGKNGLEGADTEIYDKYSQALTSLHDLVVQATAAGLGRNQQAVVTLCLPILVVPEQTLWQVTFSDGGKQIGEPKPTDRCSFFVGRTYSVLGDSPSFSFTASHLEFVTPTGLKRLVEELSDDRDLVWFPPRWISRYLESELDKT
jgi:hypothetical protein